MIKKIAAVCIVLSVIAIIISQPLLVNAEELIALQGNFKGATNLDIFLTVVAIITSFLGLVHLNRRLYISDYKYSKKK